MAAIEREWVTLESPTMKQQGHGTNPCQGLYYRPTGPKPTTAVIATHYNVDFSEHYLASYMAERGVGFLGWNTRFRGNEAYFLLDSALIDIGVGVRWLQQEAGVETIVLLGNSGGGSLMSAYQSQAVESNITPLPDLRLHEAVHELIPAQLYVALNAHPGRPECLTSWWDPSVTDEADPVATDDSLDLYAAGRTAPFAPDFIEKYRKAQRERNARVSGWVRSQIERLRSRGAFERVFNIHRVWADPRCLDLTLDPSDRSIGCYAGDPRRANYGPLGLGRTSTLRSWLSMWSLEDSQCMADQHLPRVQVPSLVIQSMADKGVFPSDAKSIFGSLGSADKELEFLPGEHYFETGGRTEVADLLAAWIQRRVR